MNDEAESPSLASIHEEVTLLLPGLPNYVVLYCVLPRVPWYARAVLKATSKAWNRALQEPCIFRDLTFLAQAAKLQKCFVIAHQESEEAALKTYMKMNTKRRMVRPLAISVSEDDGTDRANQLEDTSQYMCAMDRIRTWRKLPPIPAFAPFRILHDCGIACVNGKIFVIGGWDPCTDAVHADVHMLNIGAGLWEWEAMPPMHFPRAFFHCTSMANNIYIVGGTSSPNIEDPDPEVFNVDTHSWALLPRVSKSRSFHFNGLSLIKGSNLVLSHGFCTTDRGELIGFRRVYDPIVGIWSDYECVDDVKGDIVSKLDDGVNIASKCGDAKYSIVMECSAQVVTKCIHGVIMRVAMM